MLMEGHLLRSPLSASSAASEVYKGQVPGELRHGMHLILLTGAPGANLHRARNSRAPVNPDVDLDPAFNCTPARVNSCLGLRLAYVELHNRHSLLVVFCIGVLAVT